MLEVLVTLAIISLLLALFVPAINVAHEAARRTQCQNNLKQISLALVNYHETFEVYPPGYVARDVTATDDSTRETGPGYAWSTLLLDFLDQSPLATTIAYDLDATDPVNASAMAMVIAPFQCPTSETAAFDLTIGLNLYVLGSSSYVGMYGLGDLTASPGSPTGPGGFYRNSDTSTWTIGDGLSCTILVAERADRHDFVPGAAGVSAHSTWFAALPGATRTWDDGSPPARPVGPASFVLGTTGSDTPDFKLLRPNHTNNIAAFSSRHTGGLNAALGVSSVRFVSDEIDEAVLRALAQTNDGGLVGEF